ncbi:6-bladed beta-propeller [Planctomycetota bacterium]
MATRQQRSQRICFVVVVGALLFLPGGCGRPQQELFPPLAEPLVWPQGSAKARIAYIGALSAECDLKSNVSWLQGLGETLFGPKAIAKLVLPAALAADRDHRLFIADSIAGSVHVFNLHTRKHARFSQLDAEDTLRSPVGLALADQDLYVVDSTLHRVCVFTKEGRYRFSFGEDSLIRPSGIAYCPPGDCLFVADTAQHRIGRFSRQGHLIQWIGSRGQGQGEFNYPTHLWIDSAGLLYVSDTLNYRIQVLRTDGTFVRAIGRHGDRSGDLAQPAGVATDRRGHIYVVDKRFENIQIFDPQGHLLMAWGGEGTAPGEFWLPGGIFIDFANRIYVADSYNRRIQVFDLLDETEP